MISASTLIRQVHQGNLWATEELLSRSAPRVRNMALARSKMTRGRIDASDFEQEGLLAILALAKRTEPGVANDKWIAMASTEARHAMSRLDRATSLITSGSKSQQSGDAPAVYGYMPLQEWDALGPSAEEEAFPEEEPYTDLSWALDTLSGKEREVIVAMFGLEGSPAASTQQEAADKLGVTQATVSRHYISAIHKLRRRMEDVGPEALAILRSDERKACHES